MLRNLHCRFDWEYIGQIYGGDFAKFCGLLRIYNELHKPKKVWLYSKLECNSIKTVFGPIVIMAANNRARPVN